MSYNTNKNSRVNKVTMCKKCYAFYYRSVWHFEAPEFVRNGVPSSQAVSLRLSECPSCIEMDLAMMERDLDILPQTV